jgi:hypothetical protein
VKLPSKKGEMQQYQPQDFSTISYEDLTESIIFKNGRWVPYDRSIMVILYYKYQYLLIYSYLLIFLFFY